MFRCASFVGVLLASAYYLYSRAPAIDDVQLRKSYDYIIGETLLLFHLRATTIVLLQYYTHLLRFGLGHCLYPVFYNSSSSCNDMFVSSWEDSSVALVNPQSTTSYGNLNMETIAATEVRTQIHVKPSAHEQFQCDRPSRKIGDACVRVHAIHQPLSSDYQNAI